ncbi:TetR/AcrR family transcriptional regulator [[Mycobacterium] holstebronense]|uniref:TetR/AcrR family transcriptional regulator n=1 Tax=[Mycobacterium] holstebronense TaxID=3064288 RepID=A0ABM9M3D6_9MYCO|nr:TetR/AcrR family transcriptional regulator [Mycolicibacter sp. MU0102]CAJ1509550.1 TetR/AcrR family transcriptional regulator [Mycolicibacter sp. MU0102]
MTQPQPDHRRERILTAALQQAAHGYGGVRIRAVADAAGVPLSSVYYYFPSKDGLLLECLHSWLSDFTTYDVADNGRGTEPHQRLLSTVESLTTQLELTPFLAEAAARAYLNATGTAARKAELVRDKLIQIFADVMHHHQPAQPDHNHQVAALVADVWIANILAITQNRTTALDLCRRLEHALAAIRENARPQNQAPKPSARPSIRGA